MNFQAVLFDCDGVLVDSEPITNAVLRDMLEERGWVMSSEDCFRYFVGKAVKDHKAEIDWSYAASAAVYERRSS